MKLIWLLLVQFLFSIANAQTIQRNLINVDSIATRNLVNKLKLATFIYSNYNNKLYYIESLLERELYKSEIVEVDLDTKVRNKRIALKGIPKNFGQFLNLLHLEDNSFIINSYAAIMRVDSAGNVLKTKYSDKTFFKKIYSIQNKIIGVSYCMCHPLDDTPFVKISVIDKHSLDVIKQTNFSIGGMPYAIKVNQFVASDNDYIYYVDPIYQKVYRVDTGLNSELLLQNNNLSNESVKWAIYFDSLVNGIKDDINKLERKALKKKYQDFDAKELYALMNKIDIEIERIEKFFVTKNYIIYTLKPLRVNDFKERDVVVIDKQNFSIVYKQRFEQPAGLPSHLYFVNSNPSYFIDYGRDKLLYLTSSSTNFFSNTIFDNTELENAYINWLKTSPTEHELIRLFHIDLK